LLNEDAIPSEVARIDEAAAKIAIRKFVHASRVYLAQGCVDTGGIIKYDADIFEPLGR
jgi:hypothetical protein